MLVVVVVVVDLHRIVQRASNVLEVYDGVDGV